jgi:hypothetical protein
VCVPLRQLANDVFEFVKFFLFGLRMRKCKILVCVSVLIGMCGCSFHSKETPQLYQSDVKNVHPLVLTRDGSSGVVGDDYYPLPKIKNPAAGSKVTTLPPGSSLYRELYKK